MIGVAAVAVPFAPTWVLELELAIADSVAVAGDAAGMLVTGEDTAVGVTRVRPVPEEMHTAPLG